MGACVVLALAQFALGVYTAVVLLRLPKQLQCWDDGTPQGGLRRALPLIMKDLPLNIKDLATHGGRYAFSIDKTERG
jgi:hypothetical protein